MRFMNYTKLWFSISALLIIPGLIALFAWGLRIGIDFKGGTLIELRSIPRNQASGDVIADDNRESQDANQLAAEIRKNLAQAGIENVTVQPAGQGSVFLKTEPVNQEQHQKILEAVQTDNGEVEEVRFETVGPTISADLTQKAIFAVILASFIIIFYIAFAFRGVPKPASSWRFGISAVAALLHDLIFVIGAFAILGHFFHYEVDSLFITALLTVMGFSVHDTIVVFDRLRENLRRSPARTFGETADLSIAQTLGRSLATSLTVIIVLLALFLLGGASTKPFILALLLGITIGTYSSIFNATPLLVVWQNATSRRR